MATILVPTHQATLQAAYAVASSGDTIVLETVGPHLLPATLNKVLTFTSDVDAVVLAATGSSAYGVRAQAASSTSQFTGIAVDGGTVARVNAEAGVTITLDDCDVLEDTTTSSASYALYVQAGATINFDGGSIDTRAYAVRVMNGASATIENSAIDTSNKGTAVRHLWLEGGANGGSLTVDGCTIQSRASAAAIEQITQAAIGATTITVKDSAISHDATSGHTIGVGSEVSISGGDEQVAYDITGNTVTGFRGTYGDIAGIIHTIFVGHNVDGKIDRNMVIGGGYAFVWKGSGDDNTTGFLARNVALNANIAVRVKGVDGMKIVNNTGITKGVNSNQAFYISDNDGTATANDAVHVGNVYYAIDANYVASKRGACSFATNKNNCYICNSLMAFTINDVAKTWAEWVAATGETDSFCAVKNGSAWDVYTSAAPTVVAWSLSACPIDAATGRIVNIAGNPLLKNGSTVAGVNDDGELDVWGNATLSASNIGADQYDYAPGFGPWTPFNSSMPALSLAPTAPGSLLEVQEWSKPNITKKQIDKASR